MLQVFTARVVPLLRLLTHEAIRDSLRNHWVNPLYDSVLHQLDFAALADVYGKLLVGGMAVAFEPAAAATAAAAAAGGDRRQLRWSPAGPLDLLEPPALLLNELLERFQRPEQREILTRGQQQQSAAGGAAAARSLTTRAARASAADGAAAASPAERLLEALEGLYEKDMVAVGGGGGSGASAVSGRVQCGSAARGRRLRETLRSIRQQIKQGQSRSLILDEAEAAQRRAAEAAEEAAGRGDRAAAARLRDPRNLPGTMQIAGELRPGGPRHDNDPAHFAQVQLVPTRGELLSREAPCLPSNRPGSMPHLVSEPHRARLETVFRLLRHGVVAPLASAVCGLLQLGGLAALQQRERELEAKQRRRGGGTAGQAAAAAAHRLTLEGGTQLFVFRRVKFEGLEVTRYDGVVVRVCPSINRPPASAAGSRQAVAKWWERNKRLSHGTLVCFWWEPPGTAGAVATGGGAAGSARGPLVEPRLVVGVVAQRDPKLLSGEAAGGRPLVGLRLISAADYEQLLGAWLDSAAGSGCEVVLVQEHNSFFAYEPVLRALQSMSVIPLARHIVPGCEEPRSPTQTGSRAAAALLGFSRSQQPPPQPHAPELPELPAYLADSPVVDLRHIADRERVMQLPAQERSRVLRVLASVDLSRPVGHFSLPELLAATTLDAAQAGALRAVLSQEVAVVQGPPGTGKTYLGVVLTKALLRNTRNANALLGRARHYGASQGGPQDTPLPDWVADIMAADDGGVARAAAPAGAPRPDIGPVLAVCFTNHALDSFLEGLLDGRVTESIVRVGGNSKSERLGPYNLKALQERAAGPRVGPLYRRADELAARAERLNVQLRGLSSGLQSRPLTWEELAPLLRVRHPRLHESFQRGIRRWNRSPQDQEQQDKAEAERERRSKSSSAAAAAAGRKGSGLAGGVGGAGGMLIPDGEDGDGGWMQVMSTKKARRVQELISQDWLRGSPEQDWRHGRLAGQAGAARRDSGTGLIGSDDDTRGDDDDDDPEDEEYNEEDENFFALLGAGGVPAPTPLLQPGGLLAQQRPNAGGWDRGQPLGRAGGAGGAGGAGVAAPEPGGAVPQRAVAGPGEGGAPLTPQQAAANAAIQRMRLAAEQAEAAALAAEQEAARRRAQQRDAADAGPAAGEEPVAAAARRLAEMGLDEGPAGGGHRQGRGRGGQQEQQQQRRGQAGRDAGEAAPPEVAALGLRRRPLEELFACGDVWSMSGPERQLLHTSLQRLRYMHLLAAVREVQTEYDEVQRELQAEYDQAALATLQCARVVGMTTSGVARMQRLVAALKPRVLLVEEAAEVYEAHVLVCLSRSVEHLVLIGDHQQLRPKPNVYELQAESGRGLDLDVSLFERLVRQNGFPVATLEEQRRMRPPISRLIRETIYPALRDHPRVAAYPPLRGLSHPLFFIDHDHPEGGAGGEDRSKYNLWEAEYVVALAQHMLMQGYAPEDVVILVTYAGQLYKVREALGRVNLRVVISDRDREQLDVAGMVAEDEDEEGGEGDEDVPDGGGGGRVTVAVVQPGTSAAVDAAAAAAAAAGDAAAGGPAAERSRMRRSGDGWAAAGRGGGGGGGRAQALPAGSRVVSMREGIRVATVDNYQGEEATVILLSTVRNSPEGHIGFLRMRNRVNVMLSRARHGMVVLGHAPSLRAGAARFGVPMWGQVLDMMDADGCVGPCAKARGRVKCVNHGTEIEIPEPGDFQRLAGDGGCQLPCNQAMPCGHTCPRRCHADDRAHAHVLCSKPCQRLLSPCGHACERTCGERCGRCNRPVTERYQLECGHEGPLGVPCWKRHEAGALLCSAPVEVHLPACGHSVTVPCCEAEEVRSGRRPCSVPVAARMPACGHVLQVPCGERAAREADPLGCTATCGALLAGCGHRCGGKCGGCIRRVLHGATQELITGFLETRPAALRDAWQRRITTLAVAAAAPGGAAAVSVTAWLRFLEDGPAGADNRAAFAAFLEDRLKPPAADAPGRYAAHHARCLERCRKTLVCGHECGAACHGAAPCGPCGRSCWISCDHHKCARRCGDPCVPCAERCVWRCEHRGQCGAPCGAPCDRLPCDVRCSRNLACGHRCPGLCGEACPPAKYCIAPDCLGHRDERVRDQVVDQVMLRTFSELTPSDVDEDPLVVLPCGHAFLTSTLDGMLELEGFYRRDPATGSWLHPLPLADRQPKRACPTCRQPINGVRRYGRPINQASLELVQRKHMHTWAAKLAAAEARLRQLEQALAATAEGGPAGGGGGRPAAAQTGLEKRLRFAAERAGGDPFRLAQGALDPVWEMQAAAMGVVQAFWEVCDAYTSPPKQRVYKAALATLQRAQEEADADADALRDALAAGTAGAGEEAAAAAAAAADAGSRPGASGSGGRPPGGRPAAARLLVAQMDLDNLRPDTTQLCRAWVGELGCARVHVVAAAAGVAHAVKLLRQLMAARGRGRLGGPAPQRVRQAGMALQFQATQLLTRGLETCSHFLASRQPAWRSAAVAGSSFNGAFALSAAAMRVGLAQVELIRAAQTGDSPGAGAAVELPGVDPRELRTMREAAMEQIRAEGEAARELYHGPSGFGVQGRENTHYAAIEELLEQLEKLNQTTDIADVLMALSAVATREYGGGADAMAWLSGHLYSCPNGHLYTIGECGGAMQASTCPECGAVIGGGGHQLAGGNTRASQALAQLQALAQQERR
ncbi:hypothetical protein GPECTOR_7g955 [Gonium pectorale]|uniref:RZ-type domain-containing protein n=1 Tax=Gonium pectorale TaxID=33097 RepID=A0A150GUG6_GONPE|nr:hypothetical protein GPECTOR_7g955 [Gonium pectorale]|eukprot:KXZ53505.1 hypothetical protein GPECTOR_7g955 [Gonium pectorale]